jgi:hypothetical protein
MHILYTFAYIAYYEPVVKWGEGGSFHRPGPNSSCHEDRQKRCGAHLGFNAFWLIAHFCVHQMLMRDGMHAIDLGVIVTIIRATGILRAFLECDELLLKIEGRAAGKLQLLFSNILAHCRTHHWTRWAKVTCRYMLYMHDYCVYAVTCMICNFRGIHHCLVPATPYLG